MLIAQPGLRANERGVRGRFILTGMGSEVSLHEYELVVVMNPEIAPSVTAAAWYAANRLPLIAARRSSLLNSRTLSLYASQCVTMGVVDSQTPLGQKLVGEEKLP